MHLKRWHAVALGVVLLVLGAKHFLLDTAVQPSGEYVIDVEALHRAATGGGPLPTRIEVEKVAEFAFPRSLVVAGDGLRMHAMVLLSHRVVWADRTLVVDAAMSPGDAGQLPGSKYFRASYDRVQAALSTATQIVFTHEHPDHVGGVARADDFSKIAGAVLMTREQASGPKLDREQFPAERLRQLKLLDYDGPRAIAPGVVIQKAPGHTPGTQLVYVELESGARYLFVGDIAWSEDNITLQRGRPALATLLMKEDRASVASELRAIAGLPRDVHVVVAHDPVALRRDLAAGLFQEGFTGPHS